MRRYGWLLMMAAAMPALCGAAGCGPHRNYTAPERYERGLVVCLSGAGGMMGEVDRVREGLARGGVDHAIEVFQWSRGRVFGDQMDMAENRRKAAQLARRLESYQRLHPGRPVHLIGVSAGTGLVVWALEDLRPGARATGAVLVSSSLDAWYDLTRAMEKVRGRIYSFHSVADPVLSLGVTWAGTVDRNGGISGGLAGFSPPEDASAHTRALYEDKLVQFGWHPGEVLLGHLGDHLGATRPRFVEERIAPLVLGEYDEKKRAEAEKEKQKAAPTGKESPSWAAESWKESP